ncbi:MAG: hypothetical protein WBW53_12255 [Terriglobales bacterium]
MRYVGIELDARLARAEIEMKSGQMTMGTAQPDRKVLKFGVARPRFHR